jgi:NADH dehydrogenase/NADH:ubiquinone oxidoreductase subunit G
MKAIQKFAAEKLQGAAVFHYGTPGLTSSSQDKAEDKLLRRTSKTSNLHGAEKLGLKGWDGSGKYDSALVFRGGRAMALTDLRKSVNGPVVGVGVFEREAIDNYDVVLPGLSYVEKAGTVVNWQGKEQKIGKSIEPVGQSRSVADVFALWS